MCVIVGVNCVIRFRSICTLYNLPPGEKNDIPNIFSKLILHLLTDATRFDFLKGFLKYIFCIIEKDWYPHIHATWMSIKV